MCIKFNTQNNLLNFVALILLMPLLAHTSSAYAGDRPHDMTIIIGTPTRVTYDQGQTPTDDFERRVYFASDGTAYGTFVKKINLGVIVPPNSNSNTQRYDNYQAPDGEGKLRVWNGWLNLSILGDSTNLSLEFSGVDCTPISVGNSCAKLEESLSLRLSRFTCDLLNAKVSFMNYNPYNKVKEVTSAGPNRCEIQPGRHLNE